MNCKTCKYWYTPRNFDSMGICRRYPFEQKKLPSDWCGEYVEIIGFVKKASEK
jgi:rubredoxin